MLHWAGWPGPGWAGLRASAFAAGSDLSRHGPGGPAVAIDLAAYVPGPGWWTCTAHKGRSRAVAALLRGAGQGRLLANAWTRPDRRLPCWSADRLCGVPGPGDGAAGEHRKGQLLASWLGRTHLNYGLARYWQAASTTLDSREGSMSCPGCTGTGRLPRQLGNRCLLVRPAAGHGDLLAVLPPASQGSPDPWSF